MGSVATGDVILQDAQDGTALDGTGLDGTGPDTVVPKQEPNLDGWNSPSASSADDEIEIDAVSGKPSGDPLPPPKRKGGRKPIYATSEERKQRNRQAQAAFRERRTEYIKQLETTIQHHEESLQNLQQSHRQAADECLMLRYKNSLLERILLEKGIDVQGELALKGSPHLGPARPRVGGQASPMQKAMLNRQQQARQRPVLAPPIQTVNQPPHAGGSRTFASSPSVQPTPPSHHSSPSTSRSPGFALQGGIASPTSDGQAQHLHHQNSAPQPRQHSFAQQHKSQMRSISTPHIQPAPPRTSAGHSGYYPTTFQKHYDQLEQEYDANAGLLDEGEGEEDTDNFIPNYRLPPNTNISTGTMQASPPMTTISGSEHGGIGIQGIDPYDPMLDADPFGLTASMHFPNPFGFQPHQRR